MSTLLVVRRYCFGPNMGTATSLAKHAVESSANPENTERSTNKRTLGVPLIFMADIHMLLSAMCRSKNRWALRIASGSGASRHWERLFGGAKTYSAFSAQMPERVSDGSHLRCVLYSERNADGIRHPKYSVRTILMFSSLPCDAVSAENLDPSSSPRP